MRPTTYFIGRLHLSGARGDKRDFLWTGLQSKRTIQKGMHMWGFFDVEEFSHDQMEMMSGFLVKLKPMMEEEVADLSTHHLEQASIENRTVAKVRFFLNVRTGLIAFHRAGSHITEEQFRKGSMAFR